MLKRPDVGAPRDEQWEMVTIRIRQSKADQAGHSMYRDLRTSGGNLRPVNWLGKWVEITEGVSTSGDMLFAPKIRIR